jgi:hypothetical protein
MRAKHRQTGGLTTTRSMLRWYPARWRARYGDEFAAVVEEDLGDTQPTLRYRFSIARSGLNEQLHEVGLVGNSASPSDQLRSGCFIVLCAFALFVIPGVGFAKMSEHWDQAIHRGPRHLPAVSYNLLASLAGACAVAVILAAIAFLPAFVQFLRTGGWPMIRRRVWWAVSPSLATVAVCGGLVFWARHLTNHQRNDGFGWYQFVFAIVAILFAATVATWSVAAVAIVRHLDLRLTQVKIAGTLAVAVAGCLPVMTAAAAVWWGSMATTAPWFLAGTRAGTSPSPLPPNLLGVLVIMTIASVAGMIGLLQVIRSWRRLHPA